MNSPIAGRTASISCALLVSVMGELQGAQARPVLIEESGTIAAPDPSWEYFGRYVAVDGDWALLQGDRFVPDPNAENGRRHEGAALLFRKVGNNWSYVGVLGTIDAVDEWTKPGLAMKGGVAMVIEKQARIFERNGTAWSQANITLPPGGLQGPDVEIDNGRILVPQYSCQWNSNVYRKVGTAWTLEGQLIGHAHDCGDNPPTALQDIDGDRVAIFTPYGLNNEPAFARTYQAYSGHWEPYVEIANTDLPDGNDVALRGPYVAITSSADVGTVIWREDNFWWLRLADPLRPVDSVMQPLLSSAAGLEHGGQYFFQRNYSFDRDAYVINVFSVVGTTVTHVAQLAAKQGESLGRSFDISGNRVIVGGLDQFSGTNTARIFELPASIVPGQVRQDDFQQSGAGSDWQPVAGSAFSVAQVGGSRVYRQTSVAGNAASFLPASASRDQAIQVEVTPRSFSGADRWFGLATRQTDMANYYYVTARSSGTIQLRRMLNGSFSTLASANYPISVGRKYRLRLESIGTMHRVYVDDQLLLTGYDEALNNGRAGVIMYRTSADYDNVVITPSAFATIYKYRFDNGLSGRFMSKAGTWVAGYGSYYSLDTTAGARTIVGAAARDAVVQARMRGISFDGPDRWFGLLASYTDDQNYIYVTLRSSNILSLRRLVNGQIQALAEQPLTVSPNAWYTVRMERIGDRVRVYVNNTLRLSASDANAPAGQVGLITYKTYGEFDDFLSYQP